MRKTLKIRTELSQSGRQRLRRRYDEMICVTLTEEPLTKGDAAIGSIFDARANATLHLAVEGPCERRCLRCAENSGLRYRDDRYALGHEIASSFSIMGDAVALGPHRRDSVAWSEGRRAKMPKGRIMAEDRRHGSAA